MAKSRAKSKRVAALQLDAGGSDLGTPETRAQGAAVVYYTGTPGGGQFRQARVTRQMRVDALRSLGVINHTQHEAGERLHNDIHLAGLRPRVTVNLLSSGGGGGEGMTDRAAAAHQRVIRALSAVNADDCEVLTWVIWWELGTVYVGRRLGARSERSARDLGSVRVREALDSLSVFYGITRAINREG